ncbi:bifunctional glycosyltransferase/CDP-glycerol:glycerophosphate glycerophosphotransferase [Streptacidiphilus melanogenes]|uniref:bifunctional glycosyltransferase/CDP-glycerol:glycerophosphate glycerophosphotransferase n=1 Tax=Streptacidiphilus melanogenes TaxID=411235 RepID=UPI0005A95375|nr:bifunctional glycosyltransferase/CDP-glycerol:glycerophosphate glycerophosphotransferase [Streptacidiphilus melanogenes]
MSTPDVSVIVIVYNDAERLPRAVQSVLDQTLHSVEAVIVDDCSTDGSFEVAQRLAAQHPGRVRAFQLPENSKGCGEPRNRGIVEALGTYVMYLDSDDELELNACRNMVEAAEATGAELVSGLSTQIYIDTRTQREQPWYRWLYQRHQVLENVAELPDLFVFDTLSTNMCYRRDFLLDSKLTFVKGLLYEDLLYSAQAYLAADRIALIPNQVYKWYIRQNVAKSEKSITNRRDEIRNFSDRIEIHRRIDALLAEKGQTKLRRHKDLKFLKHDVPLYLREFPQHSAEWQRQFAELTRDYLATIPLDVFDECQPVQRVCAYLLIKEDWANLLPAIDWLRNPRKTPMPLVERNGRIYFCADHLDDETGRRMLDVTDVGFQARNLSESVLRSQLTGWEPLGADAVKITGRTVNPLGLVQAEAKLSGRMEVKARRKGLQTFSFPITSFTHRGDHVEWECTLDISKTLRPLGLVDTIWDVWLNMSVDKQRTRQPLSVDQLDLDGDFAARPRLTRLLADRLEPEVSKPGHLAFQLSAVGTAARKGRGLLFDLMSSPAGAPLKRSAKRVLQARRDLNDQPNKIRWYHRAMTRMPVKKGLVVFESHLGKQYSDSPRAIYEEMRRRGLKFHAVWSYEGKKPAKGFPGAGKDVELVERWSWPYLYALARAEYWIDNQGFPLALRKRPETTYVQTWHGSALKRMGFDMAEYRMQPRHKQDEYQRALDRFDHFVVRTEHDVDTLVRAYRLPESKVLRVGYPRNDALVATRRAELSSGKRERGPLAAELGIDPDRTIVLYAPTFREKAPELVLDPVAFAERFGEDTTLLVRSHYMQRLAVPRTLKGKVVDVTDYPDITPLLGLADALVTDYSSVMFDYALLDRPMVFYAYDYEEYAGAARGTYFDLREAAPGPFVETQDQLFDAIDAVRKGTDEFAEKRGAFATRFGEYDEGRAAAQIVDRFFGPAAGTQAKGEQA